MAFRLQLLGHPKLHRDDGSQVSLSLGKPMALLTYIACHPEGVHRGELGQLLWPEATREKARHSVRQAVWVLKNACGEDLFEGDDPLSLCTDRVHTDLTEFREALSRGDLACAGELWRGPFLDTLQLAGCRQWDHWAEDLRTDLERRFQKALVLAARELQSEGRPEDALPHLNLALEVNPSAGEAHIARVAVLLELARLDEAREALVDAQRRVGDQADAQETLEELEEDLIQAVQNQRAQVVEDSVGFPLEFVGRSRELAELRRLWRDTEMGRSRAAVITGPAGIGKTRMAREFRANLLAEDIHHVEVEGSRAEMKLRWGAAADLVRQLLLLPGSAGISSASDCLLRAMIPSLGRGEVNLATVNGVSPAALLDAINDLLEAVTFEGPLVVTLDDFQWFDGESRTVLLSVMRRARELPVLFLVLGRSDLSSRSWEGQEKTLQEEAGALRILLNPLTVGEIQELLGLVAEFSPPEDLPRVGSQIHAATGGNPLYIRLCLRELTEREILVQEGDGWVFFAKELPLRFHFPDSVRSLLEGRLHRLTRESEMLVAALAEAGRGVPLGKLKAGAGLEDPMLSRAVAQLLEREVVAWVDDTTLDFSHDLMRQAAAEQFPPSGSNGESRGLGWIRRHKSLVAAATMAAVALPLGILWGRGLPSPTAASPPMGGGTILLSTHSDTVALDVAPGPPQSWDLRRGPLPEAFKPRLPYSAQGGRTLWFGALAHEDGPDIVQLLPDGSTKLLVGWKGDQVLSDLSPDGTRIAFTSENLDSRSPEDPRSEDPPSEKAWSESLYTASLAGGEPQLIFHSANALDYGAWSADGDLLATAIRSAPDTLALFSLNGERVRSLPFREIRYLVRCGTDFLVADRQADGKHLLVRVGGPDLAADTLESAFLAGGASCSPDGTAMAFMGVRNRRVVPLTMDLGSGEIQELPTGGLQNITRIAWLSPDMDPVVTGLDADPDTVQVSWGERAPLSGEVLHSDGTRSAQGLRWQSLNPDIATVNERTEVVGNGAGTIPVVASWGYSFRDTVLVEVLDHGQGGAFIRERFDPAETPKWEPMGTPPPELTRIDGEPALRFRGDEKYQDGIRFNQPVPLDQGVTVELEFLMEVTSDVHQVLSICLSDVGPPAGESPIGVGIDHKLCLHYPAMEFEKRNLMEFSLVMSPGPQQRVTLSNGFSPSRWNHVALQVRADGEASIIVNRRPVMTHDVVMDTRPEGEWRVEVVADALGTEIFVRDLTVWREPRFSLADSVSSR